jgi:hypothetical protein
MEAAISPLPDDVEALKALVATMARKAGLSVILCAGSVLFIRP